MGEQEGESVVFSFTGRIWKIKVDATTGRLAVETRDGQTLQTFFTVLDPTTGTYAPNHFEVPGFQWGLSLAAFHSGILYLQGLDTSQHVGVPKGVLALQADTQQVLFWQEHLQWKGLHPAGLLLREPDQEPGLYDSYTGYVLGAVRPVKGIEEGWEVLSETRFPLTLPVFHDVNSPYFRELAAFIEQNRRRQPLGQIQYLETGTAFALAYQIEKEKDFFSNFLVTYNLSGETLAEISYSGSAGEMGEPDFFVILNRLFLLENATTLRMLDFPG